MSRRSNAVDDRQVLNMVRLRAAGFTSVEIAARYGFTSEKVRIATNRVMNADLMESGEPARVVLAAYWR